VNLPANDATPAWQQQRLTQVVAVVLATLPVYAFAIYSHLTREQPYSINDMIFYPLVFGGGSLLLILALLRFVCGEKVTALNLKAGVWWRDLLSGLLLAVILVVASFFLQPLLGQWFPSEPAPEMETLFRELTRRPALMVLWLGPVLWIGVAGFEELSRVFFLNRLWVVWPQPALRWLVLLLSALLFGLAHLYQGPVGVITNLIFGLLYGGYYKSYGRVWPMIISHGLYDTFWIVFGIVLVSRGLL
jgi:membrane protease YdiL (CAAX protease family)